MPSTHKQLFTVEEALERLGQNRDQGCLLVSKGAELIHIYVQDGFVVRAYSSIKEGEAAVDQALHLPDTEYTWLRGAQPPDPKKNSFLNIRELTTKHGTITKPQMGQTSRLAGAEKKDGPSKKDSPSIFRYFLVPQDKLMEKIFLTKTSTVLGRDKTADLVIDNSDVSWRHCLLDIQTRGVFILDLDSTNGTFVNGILVRDGQVNPGDRIELGPCMFTLNREAIDSR
jgi:hypothetical protein